MSVKFRIPVRPLIVVTVIVEDAMVPTVTAEGEVAAIVKSSTAKVAFVERVRAGVELVAVIVRV